MAENKQPGAVGAQKTPVAPPGSTQGSPQTSTRSRDEIAQEIREMRDRSDSASTRPDPDTVRERVRADAEAHRAAHSGDRDATVPQAAAHEPTRRDPTHDADRRELAARERRETARRYDEDDREKSSAQLEREVERERYELTRTLDQIRSRVSPGQLVDQALDYARDAGGSEFVRNLGRSVRDNPLPVVLVGAGLGWLMMSNGSGRRYRSHTSEHHGPGLRERASGMGAEVSDRAGRAADAASGMASSAKETLHRAGDRASSAFGSAYDTASDTGSAVAERARDTMRHTGEAARNAAHHAAEYAHDTRESVERNFSRLAEEQPLALGAIGIAVGAAIAALLPPTRFENRLMGPTSDALKEQVRDTAEQQYEHAREVVQEVAEEVSEEFEKRGLSAGAAADAAVGATRKAGEAAKDLAEGAKAEVRQKPDNKGIGAGAGSSGGLGTGPSTEQGTTPGKGSTGGSTGSSR